jgi:hypothetical protein
MKTIQRWLKNLKWLFNHPPTVNVMTNDDGVCEFCGNSLDWLRYKSRSDKMTICYDCLIKAFRKVLAPKKKGKK